MKRIPLFLAALFTVVQLHAQTPCEDGFAGIYPCENVNLLAHVLPADLGGGQMNDLWGWTDPLDGKEYVILGRTNGTSFFDISDPLVPLYLGNLPRQTTNSPWRDIKVYQNHAFIVSEAGSSGMQVFDLTRLRNVANPPATFTVDAFYSNFSKAHNIAINESSGRAYAVGTNTFSGGLHIMDISDPLNPQLIGDYSLDGYTHDSQVVNYIGPDSDYAGKEIAFNFNENAVTIADVTDPSDANTVSITSYPGVYYSHQGWVTEDHRYLLSNDELDEVNSGANTTTFIWDIQDLDDPQLLGTFVSATTAIDHNLYIRANLCFQSNYRGGLRILDITDIANANLSEVAFFDVYPSSDSPNFNGTWSNYPWFESGVVAVSHIESGLFLLQPDFLRVDPDTSIWCASDTAVLNVTILPGFAGPVNLSLTGLPNGAAAVFSDNNLTSPSTVQAFITGLPNASSAYSIEVLAEGLNYTYSESAVIETIEGDPWFEDADLDGYGNAFSITYACSQPLGFTGLSGDCDDTNTNVYPGAPGTSQGIDNDCNGLIEGEELAPCAGDFNTDGIRNVADLLILLADVGCSGVCLTDLSGDSEVNSGDLVIFLALFGSGC